MMRIIPLTGACLTVLFVTAGQLRAELLTGLTIVDSSPTNFVAQGRSDWTIAPPEYTFLVSRNFDNGISFDILGATATDRWSVDFAAPFDAVLVPGFYANATRFPFQEPDEAGLSFQGESRGSNTLTGFFEVLEVSYDTNGDVLAFAADFTHYENGNIDEYAIVEIRYNSTVPFSTTAVPEPASLALLSLVSVGFGVSSRRRRQKQIVA